uniref:Uncharacterized protein n=1 Tax=Anguilla anguilla TaxID=7936 RepID=A0A0E9VD44_ANGAN
MYILESNVVNVDTNYIPLKNSTHHFKTSAVWFLKPGTWFCQITVWNWVRQSTCRCVKFAKRRVVSLQPGESDL